MKKIHFLLLMLLLAVGTVFAQDEEYEGMTGTDTPEYLESSDTGKCFVFSEYVVKTDQNDDEGDNISVYKRRASTSAEDACETGSKSYLYVPDADNNAFFGLAGPYMFIDSGTSVESRGLEVYNLTSRKSVYTTSYSGDPKLVNFSFILYDASSDKAGPIRTCKEAAMWKREGGGVGWVQGKRLDLQTLRETNVGRLHCIYMQ